MRDICDGWYHGFFHLGSCRLEFDGEETVNPVPFNARGDCMPFLWGRACHQTRLTAAALLYHHACLVLAGTSVSRADYLHAMALSRKLARAFSCAFLVQMKGEWFAHMRVLSAFCGAVANAGEGEIIRWDEWLDTQRAQRNVILAGEDN